MVDRETFIEMAGRVCAPVTVVTTTTASGRPHGSTVSSFATLSIEPPLISFALERRSGLLPHLPRGARVGVNILNADQHGIASAFARRHPEPGGKFAGVTWALRDGVPYLPEPAGWTAGRVERHIDGGDHVLLVVRVDEAASTGAAPLVYARRTFGTHSGLALAG